MRSFCEFLTQRMQHNQFQALLDDLNLSILLLLTEIERLVVSCWFDKSPISTSTFIVTSELGSIGNCFFCISSTIFSMIRLHFLHLSHSLKFSEVYQDLLVQIVNYPIELSLLVEYSSRLFCLPWYFIAFFSIK